MNNDFPKKDSVRYFRTYSGEHLMATYTGNNNIYYGLTLIILAPDGRAAFVPPSPFFKEFNDSRTWCPELSNMLIILEESEIEERILNVYKNRNSKIITPPNSGEIIIPN